MTDFFKNKLSNADTDYVGAFKSFIELKNKFPNGKQGQFARVGKDQYNWDTDTFTWILSGYTPPVISERFYPVDYIGPTETKEVKQYENYAIWNPLVVDGIFINDGTVIFN